MTPPGAPGPLASADSGSAETRLYGATTELATRNFGVSRQEVAPSVITVLAHIKAATAIANHDLTAETGIDAATAARHRGGMIGPAHSPTHAAAITISAHDHPDHGKRTMNTDQMPETPISVFTDRARAMKDSVLERITDIADSGKQVIANRRDEQRRAELLKELGELHLAAANGADLDLPHAERIIAEIAEIDTPPGESTQASANQ